VPNTAISLVAGSAIIQHCANIITASGIGNGSSMVICMSIMDGEFLCLSDLRGNGSSMVICMSIMDGEFLCLFVLKPLQQH
jgi:preprotein translocase subunit SecY